MRASVVVGRIGLLVAGVLLATLVSEGAARWREHQPLFSLRLGPPVAPPRVSLPLDPEIGGGPLAADVQGAWLASPPPPPRHPPPDADLVARANEATRNGALAFEAFRVWNAEFVRRGCDASSALRRQPRPLFVFDPATTGGVQVPYRYLPGRSLPGGLVTNRFGFRGPDVPIDKPPATVRIAFVGASTTVGLWHLPWSYPELVLHWLNLWAGENRLAVRFDGVNAGREGIASAAIAAVTEQEVLPLEPDLVVYYEGANQSLCTMAAPDAPRRAPPGGPLATLGAWAARWQDVSQLARWIGGAVMSAQMHGGAEPEKPRLPPNHERDAYAAPARLGDPGLPVRERQILTDLDHLRRTVADSGALLVLTSFKWLVADGLRLDPLRDLVIYRHLNEQCWPYSYADMRRASDLHNHLVAAFASRHELPLIDVAGLLPDDPRLFYDAIHLNADGTRAQAWIIFRGLLPVIRARLDSGAWPRPDRTPQTTHPTLVPPREVTLDCPP